MTGRVVWVVDGDTIHVRIGSRLEKVRYIGANAPGDPTSRRTGLARGRCPGARGEPAARGENDGMA